MGRKKNSGRRGRKHRHHETRMSAREIEKERLVEARRRSRERYLSRILPRLERYCPLSQDGLCAPRDGKVEHYRTEFYSLEGKVIGTVTTEKFIPRLTEPWDRVGITELEALAKIKRWDPVRPKNPMMILAEAAAGQHEDL